MGLAGAKKLWGGYEGASHKRGWRAFHGGKLSPLDTINRSCLPKGEMFETTSIQIISVTGLHN